MMLKRSVPSGGGAAFRAASAGLVSAGLLASGLASSGMAPVQAGVAPLSTSPAIVSPPAAPAAPGSFGRAAAGGAEVSSSGAPAGSSGTDSSDGDASDYASIDQHALDAPAGVTGSLDTLAAYLVQPAKNDRQKARAIYRWVTANIAYDVRGFATGNPGDTRPAAVLQNRVSVCAGYASLFQALARAAGLECVVINGQAKGYGYQVGTAASRGLINHAWNAVKIDGQWQFVECTWGAGTSSVQSLSFQRQFEPFYFLTPPSEFINSHLPDDPRWQMLDRPVSGAEFDNLADVRPSLFDCGVQLESHTAAVIQCGSSVTITFRAAADAMLTAVLVQNGQKFDGQYTFAQRDGDQYAVNAAFPGPGEYVLQIFARKSGDNGPYTLALDYKVEVSGGRSQPSGFPGSFGAFTDRHAYLYS
ncbi:MAG: hypothetical protein LC772_09385, partial [Chloroflexi bacterium]|nr:hypothetical protein [Chloroflexota bacterium]